MWEYIGIRCWAFTGALGEAGRGVFMLTKGMTSTIPWLGEIAAAHGRPVMIAAMFVDPGDPTRGAGRAGGHPGRVLRDFAP